MRRERVGCESRFPLYRLSIQKEVDQSKRVGDNTMASTPFPPHRSNGEHGRLGTLSSHFPLLKFQHSLSEMSLRGINEVPTQFQPSP